MNNAFVTKNSSEIQSNRSSTQGILSQVLKLIVLIAAVSDHFHVVALCHMSDVTGYFLCNIDLHGSVHSTAAASSHALHERFTCKLNWCLSVWRSIYQADWSVLLQVEEEQMLEMWVKEETSATRTSVLEKWARLQGMPQHQAMLKYMSIIKEWPGYGSTLFDVEVRE